MGPRAYGRPAGGPSPFSGEVLPDGQAHDALVDTIAEWWGSHEVTLSDHSAMRT